MPLKTLALTFDDGPGARTIELSHVPQDAGHPRGVLRLGTAIKNDGAGADDAPAAASMTVT